MGDLLLVLNDQSIRTSLHGLARVTCCRRAFLFVCLFVLVLSRLRDLKARVKENKRVKRIETVRASVSRSGEQGRN